MSGDGQICSYWRIKAVEKDDNMVEKVSSGLMKGNILDMNLRVNLNLDGHKLASSSALYAFECQRLLHSSMELHLI